MLARARQRVGDFALDWGAPILLGLTTAAVVWTIWYITKVPCTTVAATNGLCNPGVVARFIAVEILLQSGGAALAVGALKGGYDRAIMRRKLNEEREARQQAELELIEARKRNEESTARLIELREEALRQANAEREEAVRMFAEIINEFRAERREVAEERQQNAAIQQALLDAILQLAQRNGNGRSENSDA